MYKDLILIIRASWKGSVTSTDGLRFTNDCIKVFNTLDQTVVILCLRRCKDCKTVFHLTCKAPGDPCPRCQRMRKYLERDLQDWASHRALFSKLEEPWCAKTNNRTWKQNLAFTWSNLKCNYECASPAELTLNLKRKVWESRCCSSSTLSCTNSWCWHDAAKFYWPVTVIPRSPLIQPRHQTKDRTPVKVAAKMFSLSWSYRVFNHHVYQKCSAAHSCSCI